MNNFTRLSLTSTLLLLTISTFSRNYYVSPTGVSTNDGLSFNTAKDLKSSLSAAVAGDFVILESGSYNIPYTAASKNTITLSQSGNANAYISVSAEPGAIATIDFQFPEFTYVQDSYGFLLSGSYWKFNRIKITRAGYQGIYVTGGYNIFDYCIFYNNRNSGIEINKGGHHTTLINCDAYFNYDPKKGGSMADGFAVKQTQGAGNVLIGCRSWDNSDDAYDTFDSPEFVTFKNCWAFNNGINIYNDPNITFAGNGNGFKVGGNYKIQHNYLENCVAFGHPKKGFDQNNNYGGITFLNCTSYNNGINFGIGGTLTEGNHTVKNCISLNSASANSFTTNKTIEATNSWSSGINVTASDFQSLDLNLASIERNIDGSIPETALFRLKSGSTLIDKGTNVGLIFNGSAPDLGAFETPRATYITNTLSIIYYNTLIDDYLYLNNLDTNNSTITIYTITGNSVKTEQLQNENQIYLGDLKTGIYIATIQTENKTYSFKIKKK